LLRSLIPHQHTHQQVPVFVTHIRHRAAATAALATAVRQDVHCSDLLKTQMIRTPLLLQWSLVNTHDTHPFITAVISCKHKWYAPLYLMLETFTYVSDLNMWPYAVCTCGLCIIFTYVSDLNIWPNISLYVWPMWYIDICVWSVHLAICDLHTLPMWYNHICVWSVYVVMI